MLTQQEFQLVERLTNAIGSVAIELRNQMAFKEPRDSRKICRQDLVEQIHSIEEGQVIKVVPEHECEFYTDRG